MIFFFFRTIKEDLVSAIRWTFSGFDDSGTPLKAAIFPLLIALVLLAAYMPEVSGVVLIYCIFLAVRYSDFKENKVLLERFISSYPSDIDDDYDDWEYDLYQSFSKSEFLYQTYSRDFLSKLSLVEYKTIIKHLLYRNGVYDKELQNEFMTKNDSIIEHYFSIGKVDPFKVVAELMNSSK